MTKRAILHIGHPKTATTFLQSAMHLNEEAFASAGIWVPSDFRGFGGPHFRTFAEQGRSFEGNLSPAFYAAANHDENRFVAIMNYIFADRRSDVLLSSELIFYYPHFVHRLANQALARGFSPVIVAYLQRQDRALVSGYLQNVRNHGVHSGIIAFVEHNKKIPYFRYYVALSNIRSLCGPTVPVIVRTFAGEFLKGGEILDDFVALLNPLLDPAMLTRPSKRSNNGLTLEFYEVLRALNFLEERAFDSFLSRGRALSQSDRDRLHGYYYRSEIQRYVQDHLASDNGRLLAEYMPEATDKEKTYWSTVAAVGPEVTMDPSSLAEALESMLRHLKPREQSYPQSH